MEDGGKTSITENPPHPYRSLYNSLKLHVFVQVTKPSIGLSHYDGSNRGRDKVCTERRLDGWLLFISCLKPRVTVAVFLLWTRISLTTFIVITLTSKVLWPFTKCLTTIFLSRPYQTLTRASSQHEIGWVFPPMVIFNSSCPATDSGNTPLWRKGLLEITYISKFFMLWKRI